MVFTNFGDLIACMGKEVMIFHDLSLSHTGQIGPVYYCLIQLSRRGVTCPSITPLSLRSHTNVTSWNALRSWSRLESVWSRSSRLSLAAVDGAGAAATVKVNEAVVETCSKSDESQVLPKILQ